MAGEVTRYVHVCMAPGVQQTVVLIQQDLASMLEAKSYRERIYTWDAEKLHTALSRALPSETYVRFLALANAACAQLCAEREGG